MRILVIKLSSMGDLFHALPAVHMMKKGLNADVDWVTHDYYVDLVSCFSDVDRVIPFHRKAFFRNFNSFVTDLRKNKYDIVVDMQGLLKSAVVTMFADGVRKIGPSFHREGTGIFYTEIAGARNKERHAVEENLDFVRHLGLEVGEPEFHVEFPKTFSSPLASPCIGILPASRWNTKNWPAKCFAEVAKRLQKVSNASIILLGGPGDSKMCAEIESELNGNVINMAGKSTLVEMGGILSSMDLLISNDSGPVHMAAATGTPALVVFGPTSPLRTGPYGKMHRVVKESLECQPCLSRTCKRDGIPCLSGVTPERVGEAALEMIAKI